MPNTPNSYAHHPIVGGNRERSERHARHDDEFSDGRVADPAGLDALGVFDLDPAGAPNHPTALEIWTPENGHDGLEEPWHGRVWLNPPYGRIMRRWIDKMVEHNHGTALIPVATGTKLWMDAAWPNATAIHFWRHRINFLRRDGLEDSMVSPAASALIAFGEEDAERMVGANLPGVCVDFR